MRLREYLDRRGRSPFAEWFDGLPAATAVRITAGLARMEAGNLSNAKSVGDGVSEYRMDFGPGFRISFAVAGSDPIILLAGGTKRRQEADIRKAKQMWLDYMSRKEQ